MQPFSMILTPSAEDYFAKKIGQDKAIQLHLKASGCSGYSYVLNIVDKDPSNLVIRKIPFSIQEKDKPMLNNVIIDIKKDGLNSRLVFDNPQAHNHCGCGESFSINKQ